jgi:Domain of unknown function (DUF4157)
MSSFKPLITSTARPTSSTPSRSKLLQRKCACGGTVVADGECAECRKKRLQTKLAVNQPGDRFEREADRMAEFVVNGGREGPVLSTHSLGVLQREEPKTPPRPDNYDEAIRREEETVQRKALSDREISSAPPIVDDVLQSSGEPLEADTRRFFEKGFGYDFGAVRVHRDARAAESARAVHGEAYTVGRDVVFGAGQYAPATAVGQRLMAHELAHVVQQGAAKPIAGSEAFRPASVALMAVQRQGGGGSSPISNVSLTTPSKPNVVRQLGGSMVQVTFDKNIAATGAAQVSGPDAGKYEFGFLQICRPFDVMRATYHESGAPSGPGKDLNRDGTNGIRKVQPALDHATDWYDGKSAKGPSAKVDFSDRPSDVFEKSTMKNQISYDITGVAGASFFFTAFAVRGPDGKFQPLKTVYWAFNHCEPLPPGTDLSKPKIGAPVVVSSVATCPGCSENEPGFSKINDPRGADTCLSLVSNAWGSVMFDGPGTFSINC